MSILGRFIAIFSSGNAADSDYRRYLTNLLGKAPKNLVLYKQALRHTSLNKHKKDHVEHSNERLEYLGDAVLGLIVAEFLFKKYPYKDEGFLTEIRSRIVNGEHLGQLSKRIGLNKFVEHKHRGKHHGHSGKSINGDALEALIGALYLDRGYNFTRRSVMDRILEPFVSIEEIVKTEVNFKSKLLNWAQIKGKKVRFEIIAEKDHKHFKEFHTQALVDGEPVASGSGNSKKKAEQNASKSAIAVLEI